MRIIGNILNDMIKYYGNDVRLTNHALKVYGFVKCIGESENLDKEKMRLKRQTMFIWLLTLIGRVRLFPGIWLKF